MPTAPPHHPWSAAGPASRARDFFETYTKDLRAGDLQRLFTRDAREAYEFFARGIDRSGVEKMPWHARLVSHVRLFFMAFTMRLSPARRMLYAAALVFSIVGLVNLFAGVGFYRVADGRLLVPIPLPLWPSGTVSLALGFLLLNLLVMLEVADRLSLKHDLNIARDIQLAMLPQGTYRAPGVEVHGETRPANTVGGDLYDLIPLPDGRLVFVVGDVAGKGSPAALLMALLIAMMRTLVDEGLEPGPLLERLNAQVLRHAPRSRFVTLFFAIYEPDGRLVWVNAGQNPPHIRRVDGHVDLLPASGLALGMFEGSTYTAQETTVWPGDLLVAYSDGITEAEHGTTQQPFDESGLDAVLTAWSAASTPEICRAIIDGVTAHVGEARFADDLTVLVLKRM